jgi:hypothetical protein
MSARQGFPVSNGYAPAGGPRALPISFDFGVTSPQATDLVQEIEANIINMVQSIYVDNSLNANILTIVFDQTNQKIVIPATAQGIWPVITPKDAPRLVLSTTPAGGCVVNIILLNVPMPLTQWGPVNVATTINNPTFTQTPTVANAIDHGGTITLGGTSQVLVGANAVRHRLLVENPSVAANSLYINFTATAGVGATNSIEIMPGGYYDTGNGPVSGEVVNITSPDTAAKFICKEW